MPVRATPRFLAWLAAAVLLGVAGLWFAREFARDSLRDVREFRAATRPRPALPVGASLPSFGAVRAWLNGGPLPDDSLRAPLTAVVVWSDTDPRARTLLPMFEELHEAFARSGLRVVGVHAPEHAFAADPAVPARFLRRLGIGFPVALDPGLTLQRALGGAAGLPRVVLSDASGRVIRNAGEWNDAAVRLAIAERLGVRLDPWLHAPGAAAGLSPSAPEVRVIPLGAGRVTRGPLARAVPGEPQTFTAQFRYQEEGEPGVPFPVGRWTPAADGLVAARGGAADFVALRYDAVHAGPVRVGAVLSPPPEGPVRVWVLCEERWLPHAALGEDARLDDHGASFVEVDEPRLYDVARGGGVYKLSPAAPGLTVHAFTLEAGAR
jgi:hypothetical protein